MADSTDIYTNNERRKGDVVVGSQRPKVRRLEEHRRSGLRNQEPRRRRSLPLDKRLRHWLKKPESAKHLYLGILIFFGVLLLGLAIWDFWYRDLNAKKEYKAFKRSQGIEVELPFGN